MSKEKNYIIVLGGISVIIGIIIFGAIKHFVYPDPDIELQRHVIDFLTSTIYSTIGTGLIIAMILNLIEKKDLKEVTKLNNEYSKTIIDQQATFITQLSEISQGISKINENENERNRLLLIKDKKHDRDHETINKRFESLETKIDEHIENHN